MSNVTCVSCDESNNSSSTSDESGTEPNSEESCGSNFASDLDDFFPSPTTTITKKRNSNNSNNHHRHLNPPSMSISVKSPSSVVDLVDVAAKAGFVDNTATSSADYFNTSTALVAMPPAIQSEVVPVEEEDGSFALEALVVSGSHDDYESDNDEEEDSLAALDRLIGETSKRWEESCQQTHKEFCRIPNCGCKTQDIIDRQAAEIEALRAQLEARDQYRYHPGDDEPRDDFLPVEQIEVYHDNEDHLSVTSGLTHMYDLSRVDDASVFQTGSKCNEPIHRPDADSVTGIQSVQPSRVRDFHVFLLAADGTTRRALYSGPIVKNKPNGCGILKFVESGDVYMGDLVDGAMHGSGTYTFVNSKSKPKVLKGTFENNVFIG